MVIITRKQETFCQNIFLGKSATEAALTAGYSKRTAYSQGARLLKNVEIARRLSDLQSAIANGNILTKAQRLERLTKIAQADYKDPIVARDAIQAIAEMNKMLGDYAPEKHIVANVDVVFVIGKGYQEAPKQLEPARLAGGRIIEAEKGY